VETYKEREPVRKLEKDYVQTIESFLIMFMLRITATMHPILEKQPV